MDFLIYFQCIYPFYHIVTPLKMTQLTCIFSRLQSSSLLTYRVGARFSAGKPVVVVPGDEVAARRLC